MEETFITSPHFANEKAESRRLPKITVRFQGSVRRAGQMATLAGETSRVISGTLGHLHSASLHSGSWDGYRSPSLSVQKNSCNITLCYETESALFP